MDREDVIDLYVELRSRWAGRNGRYDRSRRLYLGDHWDATNPPQRDRYSLTLNYLKPFVDKSVQLLVGRLPAIQVIPPGVEEEQRRLAEQLEGILYGTWEQSNAADVFARVAHDSFVLGQGVVYVWWDPEAARVRFKNCVPERFYPDYDGDEVWRCVYVHRRRTERLKREYPDLADEITEDEGGLFEVSAGSTLAERLGPGETTVIDVYEAGGGFWRVMGNAIVERRLALPFPKVPFVVFPCWLVSGDTEPLNAIDQVAELNQYLDQLVSQHADIISRYANPTVIDRMSGQPPELIRRALAAPGGVIPVKKDGDLAFLSWQGSLPAVADQVQLILDALFDLAGKPRSAFGQTVTNQSGVVTNLALTPTLQSNEYHESLWGRRLSELNEWILALWEKNWPGKPIELRGRRWNAAGALRYFEVAITGSEIGGWYKNRVKWPSAIRTDDPVYVQNLLSQLTSDPPAISLYTYLEEMGVEDVEAEIDRIYRQLEDPRLHPERLQAALSAATGLAGLGAPGLGPPLPEEGVGPSDVMVDALEAAGSPQRDVIANAY